MISDDVLGLQCVPELWAWLNVSVARDCYIWLQQGPHHSSWGQGSIAMATGGQLLVKPNKHSTKEQEQE